MKQPESFTEFPPDSETRSSSSDDHTETYHSVQSDESARSPHRIVLEKDPTRHMRHTFENGDVYDGTWQDGKMHGYGVYYFKRSGNQYTGEWANGKKEGHGKFYHADTKETWTGHWKNGQKHGKGQLIDPAGNKFDGEWVDGNIQGTGTYTYPSGGTLTGFWKDGSMLGEGQYTEGTTTVRVSCTGRLGVDLAVKPIP
eukprot:TRINITY_DN30939_c0_g1_i1.p1 TRINITY_DN30939_c0_g1~~TRINITY_DN30939_c0_g1_i1.p1  ORF type:complete len:198 (+),score=28.07 TRINITY_DN30939_c0_g1_i1:35-628(+)